jgi:hypothetical protein
MLKIDVKYDENIHNPLKSVVTSATCFNIQIICICHRICMYIQDVSN